MKFCPRLNIWGVRGTFFRPPGENPRRLDVDRLHFSHPSCPIQDLSKKISFKRIHPGKIFKLNAQNGHWCSFWFSVDILLLHTIQWLLSCYISYNPLDISGVPPSRDVFHVYSFGINHNLLLDKLILHFLSLFMSFIAFSEFSKNCDSIQV